ncbi:MAG: hypothetical protein KF866_09375 [Phycisphaeraceae bacterium]|nr:hypothetical protein [Phycisphaeraceae bacterium]
MKRVLKNGVAAACLCALAGLAHGQTAQVIAIGSVPGGFDFSQAWGVSRDGSTVIGITNGDLNGIVDYYGFRASIDGTVELIPSIVSRDIRGVSGDAGVLAGIAFKERPNDPGEYDLTGWYWTADGGVVDLWSPILNWGSTANAVSRDGSAVVGMTDFFINFGAGFEFSDAYVWRESTGVVKLPHLFDMFRAEAFGVSANGSVIVGYEQNMEEERFPVVWEAANGNAIRQLFVTEEELGSSLALVVSDNGAYAAGFSLMAMDIFGYREDLVMWDVATGAPTVLGQTPPGFYSAIPAAISDDGQMIVGTYNRFFFFDNPEGEIFVWRQGEGVRLLKNILTDDYGVDLTGWQLLAAHGMSEDGKTIVGHGLDPHGNMTGIIIRLDVSVCVADLSGSSDPNDPAYGVPDGQVDASDFFYFLDQFVAGNDRVADLSGSSDPNDPAYGVPDGQIDASDFFYYLDRFVAGCP